MLKVLLAGLGVRGRYWADVINRSDRAEIVAYADPNPTALEHAIADYGKHPTYDSTESALEDLADVDALVLANPPIGRDSQIQAAVSRNIPMLIEKPLALDLQEAAHLVKIAEDADISLMVGLNFRYLDVTIQTVKHLADSTVGQPEFARFTYERWRDGERPNLNKYPLTMAHPMLWEQSIHHFDLMRYVYGQEPVSIQCNTWNPSWSMYDDDTNVAAIFQFDGGMTVNYQGTWMGNWSNPGFEWRTECSEGVLIQRNQFGDLGYALRDNAQLTPVALTPHERWVSDTVGLFDAFLAHVLDDKPLQCSGRDHLMSLAMVEACIQSSKSNTTIHISDVLPDG
ncbi:MAG: Gfo/Idh/MocA family protein [Aggregatilineales bacterium]